MNQHKAFELFDRCEAINDQFLLGRWKGNSFITGHPLDGLLEAYGWYGKEFISSSQVHPLLFKGTGNSLLRLQSKGLPLNILLKYPLPPNSFLNWVVTPLKYIFDSEQSSATLQSLQYRGITSTSMVYDHQPISDHFRKLDDNTVLGVMDSPLISQPFFFQLTRDRSAE